MTIKHVLYIFRHIQVKLNTEIYGKKKEKYSMPLY